MKDKYIEECKIISQNCTYTAEAHHQMAISAKRKATLLEVVPAICAALSGSSLVIGWGGHKTLLFATISSVVVAVSAILNPNKTYQLHLEAAKNFTALKHDSRFTQEAISEKLSDDAFAIAVENLHARYNDLMKAVPPTSKRSFAKARNIVQSDIHEPDRDKEGNIK